MEEFVKENELLKERMETMVEAQVCLFTCLFALFSSSLKFLIVRVFACFFLCRVQFS